MKDLFITHKIAPLQNNEIRSTKLHGQIKDLSSIIHKIPIDLTQGSRPANEGMFRECAAVMLFSNVVVVENLLTVVSINCDPDIQSTLI